MRKPWEWALAGLVVLATGPVGAAGLVRAEVAVADTAVEANNDFAFDLYKRLAASEGNRPCSSRPTRSARP